MDDKVEYFQLDSGRYSYYVSIRTKFNTITRKEHSYTINVGGKMKGCIEITVERPSVQDTSVDERYAELESTKNVAYISWIGYSPKCSIDGNLISGVGTRHMIRAALTIVCNRFDWITQFSLDDASTVKCVEKITVNLAFLSIALNGKTYYEKYLNAYLEEPLNQKYKAGLDLIKSLQKKPFQTFIEEFQIHNKEIKDYIRDPYESTITFQEFFTSLNTKCKTDTKHFCAITQNWLEPLINYLLANRRNQFFMAKWFIDKESIKSIAIDLWENVYDHSVLKNIREAFQEEFKQNGGSVKTPSSYFGNYEDNL